MFGVNAGAAQPARDVSPERAAPVGVFDSGLGGLSVLAAIRARLPDEALLFCADSRHAPYGGRDDAFVADRSLAVCQWLLGQGAKALVVACNTATAQVIETLRARFAVPVVGVEPGIKVAAAASAARVAGVLATAGTLRSARFRQLLAAHAGDCRFVLQAGHGLVDAIERGDTGSPELLTLLAQHLAPILAAGADTLVLGSTHYPLLGDAIRRVAGAQLTLIDTGMAVARQLERLLDAAGMRAPAAAAPSLRFCSTGDGTAQRTMLRTLLGIDAAVVETVAIPSAGAGADDCAAHGC